MDPRRYCFIEQLVIMVLAGNKGLLVNLDNTGFLGSTGLVGFTDFNWFSEFYCFSEYL